MEYQSGKTVAGQWYVSDNGTLDRGPYKRKRCLARDKSRVAGPFLHRIEAEAAQKQFVKDDPNLKGNRLYVWRA